MDNSLKGIQPIKPRLYIKKPYQELSKKVLLVIDIAAISSIAFHYNIKRADNKVFNTSLYEIDYILGKRKEIYKDLDLEPKQEDISEIYKEYLDAFSKKASDILAPHRPYDHKIILESENKLGSSPLYKMTTKELEICKKYLVENLYKGFIKLSQSPFAAPILFIRKSDRLL